ncbi:MAG: hypothetical protein R3D98_09090 [Candidatus Krumholzibacteriia bacterium]
MKRTRGSLAIGVAAACLQAAVAASAGAAAAVWQPKVSAGLESYVHTYYLATADTTEAVSEVLATAEIEGRSGRRDRHAWNLRLAASGGSELLRELLDGRYQWRPSGEPRLQLDVDWLGRQYRSGTEYALSSDNHEGTAECGPTLARPDRPARSASPRPLSPLPHAVDPRTELPRTRRRGLPGLRGFGDLSWRVGARAAARTYPDSTALDRDLVAVEADLDHAAGERHIWLYQRSERRLAAAPEVRPSAWSHWTEVRATWPLRHGEVVTSLGSEVWRYDRTDTVWFDSWRLESELGYGWGDPLRAHWRTLLTMERLDADAASEAYQQFGLRGTVESYAGPVSGMLALEYGHRWYRQTADEAAATDPFDDTFALAYSDFSYVEIWLMATWTWSDRLSLEVVASYQPEQHTEQDDDTAIGYGSARVVWRP